MKGILEPPTLCFIGFGEVSYHWIRSLCEEGYPRERLQVCYLSRRPEGLEQACSKASILGIRLTTTQAEVANTTRFFVHATTPGAAPTILEGFLPILREGQTWIDVNSTSPAVKVRMAEAVEARGAHFIDAAIMAPVWKHGHRVPLFIAGKGMENLQAWASAWGMNLIPVGPQAGQAARVKMCRSIIMKGIATSFVEGMLLAEMLGIPEAVQQSLALDLGADLLPGWCERFILGTLRHAKRRAEEMAQVIDTCRYEGWDPVMPLASQALLQRIAALEGKEATVSSQDYREALRMLLQLVQTQRQAKQVMNDVIK